MHAMHYLPTPEHSRRMTSEELRAHFLVRGLFTPGAVMLRHIDLLAPLGLWFMYRRRASDEGRPFTNGRLTAILLTAEIAAGIIFNSID